MKWFLLLAVVIIQIESSPPVPQGVGVLYPKTESESLLTVEWAQSVPAGDNLQKYIYRFYLNDVVDSKVFRAFCVGIKSPFSCSLTLSDYKIRPGKHKVQITVSTGVSENTTGPESKKSTAAWFSVSKQ